MKMQPLNLHLSIVIVSLEPVKKWLEWFHYNIAASGHRRSLTLAARYEERLNQAVHLDLSQCQEIFATNRGC